MREKRTDNAPLLPSPFIVSVGRSGTTLLRLMLDSHPEMAIPPETHFIPTAVRNVKAARIRQIKSLRRNRGRRQDVHRFKHVALPGHEQYESPRRTFADVLTSWRTWADYGIDKEELLGRLSSVEPFSLSAGLRTFYGLYAEKFGKERWGDKTPRYATSMKLIKQVLPEARFIYLIRDGRDVALSVKNLWFGPDSVEEAARWWRSRVLDARAQARKLPGSSYMEMRYEDLISEPETELKKVCAFLNLPWTSSMLEYHEVAHERMVEISRDVVSPDGLRTIGAEERAAIFSLTDRPPQASRVGRWRTEMEDAERVSFEEIAGDLLVELGYPVGQRSGSVTR